MKESSKHGKKEVEAHRIEISHKKNNAIKEKSNLKNLCDEFERIEFKLDKCLKSKDYNLFSLVEEEIKRLQ